ncbi:hypothetical protein [Allomuricauda sp. F6463D]|uniref:hypothetical protein n=1 Tax=Allomuricauda sp. F6463D TaxID=2926409 RepID=UPI001FF43BF8|nr:hypothetical protein [Muricauda sp. F6463D]MCK0161827.1 hypothetical protein [Muricauda sp. F6463D]
MKLLDLTTIKLFHYLLFCLLLIFFSCSGEDGETGPAGQDGNANIFVSDWMPIVWTWKDLDIGKAFMDIPIENISTYIDNGGVVMMYLKHYNSVRVFPISLGDLNYLYFSYGMYPANENKQTESFNGIRFSMDAIPININLYQVDSENIRIRYVLVPADVDDQAGLIANIPATFVDVDTLSIY